MWVARGKGQSRLQEASEGGGNARKEDVNDNDDHIYSEVMCSLQLQLYSKNDKRYKIQLKKKVKMPNLKLEYF